MSQVKPIIPANLSSLWREEDSVINWSLQIIAEPDRTYLVDHLELVEVYMDCVDQLRQKAPTGDYHSAYMGLFLRSFDSLGRCVRSALSGDYTCSAMMARDLLETQFLISYLQDDPKRPVEWLHADPKQRKKVYKPVEIRQALDARDGFKERKREQHYGVLSGIAHPTPMSFQVKVDGKGRLGSGPQRNPDLLEGCLQEAARQVMLLGACLALYALEVPDGEVSSSRLSLLLQKNRAVYFGANE